jgi:hypothetical protein
MRNALCRLLIVLVIWTPYQIAQAGMIETYQGVAGSSQSDRATVLGFVGRSEVMSRLQALGVDPATAKDRVAAMTDEEARTLAGRIDSMPAGGQDLAGYVLLIIIVFAIYWWVWRR